MKTQYLVLSLAGLLVAGPASAAPPHAITYSKKSAGPGTVLNISGVEFTVIRMPIVDFSGVRYAITLPVPSQSGVVSFSSVTTTHSTDPIGTNLQIDGFNAFVEVGDSRTYSLNADFSNPGTNTFTVEGFTFATARIQVGTMVVDLSEFFSTVNPLPPNLPPETQVNIGASFNAVSFAEFWKWTDPVTKINALDLWIDFIRIVPL